MIESEKWRITEKYDEEGSSCVVVTNNNMEFSSFDDDDAKWLCDFLNKNDR